MMHRAMTFRCHMGHTRDIHTERSFQKWETSPKSFRINFTSQTNHFLGYPHFWKARNGITCGNNFLVLNVGNGGCWDDY